MELYELKWDWIYVFIVFTFALFVSTVSFDMIAHWENKKQTDTRILIIGSGVFAFAVLLLTSTSNQLMLLITVVLLTMILSGLIATNDRFSTKTKPWELYLIAILSLATVLFTSGMAVFKASKGDGRSIQDKQYEINRLMKMRKMGA